MVEAPQAALAGIRRVTRDASKQFWMRLGCSGLVPAAAHDLVAWRSGGVSWRTPCQMRFAGAQASMRRARAKAVQPWCVPRAEGASRPFFPELRQQRSLGCRD